ncbi:uncharacterized protein LOC143215746 isoform X2 [Lasioglossum baleicum]|uniref:uncharacterized protein LOC143215746 isoform X2 n=1 Tax=Lasioglossum baleicum TaxID=434251 RepID=UPI003FCC3883
MALLSLLLRTESNTTSNELASFSCFRVLFIANVYSVKKPFRNLIFIRTMRTFLPMVCLLARVVVGNMEIGSNFSDMARSRNEDHDNFENRTKKSGPWIDDVSKEWNGDADISLAMETGRKEVDPEGIETDEIKGRSVDLLQNVAKRGEEPMDSWLDTTTKEKASSQEKKDPWTYWWGGKRISSQGQNSDIRRPIRVPFNSWGGKRGRVVYPRHPESNLFADDRIGNDHVGASVDGYGVNRRAEIERSGWKTPFSSWGGKRARNANAEDDDEVQDQDREQYSSPPVHHILGLVADEFPKSEKAERFKGERNALRGKIEMAANDDGWGGKSFPYRKPTDNNGNWLVQTYRLVSTKRAQPEKNKTLSFGPWHGKRNLRTYTLRLGDEYLEVPRRSAKEGLGFFSWAG